MREFASVLLALLLLTPTSCTRSDSPSRSGSGSGDEAGSGAEEGAKPISLTDARLDQYLAFRKEFNRLYAGYMKEAVAFAKNVDSKSTSISKGIAVATGVGQLQEGYNQKLSALRAKHGFMEAEDERLWSAVSEVVAAKPLDNPMMADGLKSYREMQARGGDEKKAADQALQSFKDEEQKGLAEARQKYGDACVEVLSKRVKELGQFQLDSMKEMAAQAESEKK